MYNGKPGDLLLEVSACVSLCPCKWGPVTVLLEIERQTGTQCVVNFKSGFPLLILVKFFRNYGDWSPFAGRLGVACGDFRKYVTGFLPWT